MYKVVIDTDIGSDVDDAYALAFALMRPELDVLAITTACGPTVKRARIAQRLLRSVADAMDMADADLPLVAAGDGEPLTPFPAERLARIMDERPNQFPYAEDRWRPVTSGAVRMLEHIVTQHPGDVSIVTIGAMTNVGRLLRDRPHTAPMIKQIASMGGSFEPDRAEYNIACDPVAASIVLESDVPRALFSWEVTRRIVLLEPEMARLREAATPAAHALCELTDLWTPHRGAKPGPVLYDVCPLMWLFRPDLFAMTSQRVSVVTEPGPEFGRTPRRDGDTCLVADAMDAPAATDLLMQTLAPPA